MEYVQTPRGSLVLTDSVPKEGQYGIFDLKEVKCGCIFKCIRKLSRDRMKVRIYRIRESGCDHINEKEPFTTIYYKWYSLINDLCR